MKARLRLTGIFLFNVHDDNMTYEFRDIEGADYYLPAVRDKPLLSLGEWYEANLEQIDTPFYKLKEVECG